MSANAITEYCPEVFKNKLNTHGGKDNENSFDDEKDRAIW